MEHVADSITLDTKQRMDSAITSFKHALSGLRTGRASASLLEPIKVELYGSYVPISQVGSVNVSEARLITVQVWDKNAVKHVEKAITNAGLGLNPVSAGQIIRIPIPDLSEERRKELCKKVSEYAENTRIALRNIRRDSIESLKKMEKEKKLSEDALKQYSDEVQKIIEAYSKKVEEISAQKAKDIMSV